MLFPLGVSREIGGAETETPSGERHLHPEVMLLYLSATSAPGYPGATR